MFSLVSRVHTNFWILLDSNSSAVVYFYFQTYNDLYAIANEMQVLCQIFNYIIS